MRAKKSRGDLSIEKDETIDVRSSTREQIVEPAQRIAFWIRTRNMALRWCEHDLVQLEGRFSERGVERADRASAATGFSPSVVPT